MKARKMQTYDSYEVLKACLFTILMTRDEHGFRFERKSGPKVAFCWFWIVLDFRTFNVFVEKAFVSFFWAFLSEKTLCYVRLSSGTECKCGC